MFMPRKKNNHLGPRRKRMTRQGRLSSARATRWVEKYEGKNIIAGYANWFAVDPQRENEIKASIEARAATRKRRQELRAQAALEELPTNSDDNFAYIAGYTPGGVPYGVTWEELDDEALSLQLRLALPERVD